MLKELKDLGVLKINPITKTKLTCARRFKMYECPVCLCAFPSMENNVKRGQVASCRSCQVAKKNLRHGNAVRGKTTKLYRRWLSFRNRCNNPKNPSYKTYGARGITVCNEWNDFDTFKVWAYQTGYEEHLEIDREDNDGSYSPQNCRWTNSSVQSANGQILRQNNTSGYRGVTKGKTPNTWIAQIRYKNVKHHLGVFPTKILAAEAYNLKVVIENWPHAKNEV